jgi:mevalonate kinase
MTTASAPGKVILFGEHAVVYGQPALAIPVHEVQAVAKINAEKETEASSIFFSAPDIDFQGWMKDMDPDHPLVKVCRLTFDAMEYGDHPNLQIKITSTIPIASGMGSSAAITIAIIRALGKHFETTIQPELQSQIAFEVEKLHHGTPSGIDNTVIAYEQPVFYQHGKSPQVFNVGMPIRLIIANSGRRALTSEAVGQVRKGWQNDPPFYDSIFDQIGSITHLARDAIQEGQIQKLGSLMNQNQESLRQLKVSSPALEKLIQVALEHGAMGAKLSGAGLGGNMIALVSAEDATIIQEILITSGAVTAFSTVLEP